MVYEAYDLAERDQNPVLVLTDGVMGTMMEPVVLPPMKTDEELAARAESIKAYEEAMEDDFNTADAITAIFELVKYCNTTATAESSKEYVNALFDLMVKLTDVLGLIVVKEEEMLAEDIEKLIAERQAARKAKNFARADEIRDELLAKGIILKDTREGVKWTKA